MRRWWLLAASVVLAGGSPAAAYVRAVNKSNRLPWFWNQNALQIVADVGEPVRSISNEDIVNAVNGAAAAWSHGVNDCTVINITVTTKDDPHTPTIADGVNRLAFRRVTWCLEPPPTNPDVAPCHGPEALALTTTTTDTNTGRIIDADIEVNAAASNIPRYTWTDLIAHPAKNPDWDLQNAVTHEMGHFLGFAHSCLLSTMDVAVIDDRGQPVPFFPGDDQAMESTMYPTAAAGDLARRTLSEDDARGLCELYPGGLPSGLVQSGGPVGCEVAKKQSGPAPGALGPLSFSFWWAARRRRRARY
jgi:hypothetical protein